MPDTAIELRSKANDYLAEQRKILDAARSEKRSLTAEERQQIDRIDKMIDDNIADAERYERSEKRSLVTSNRPGSDNPIPSGGKGKNRITDYFALRDEKRRSTKRYSVEYRSWLQHGPTVYHRREMRALQADRDDMGGFLVAPMQMSQQYIKAVDDLVFMRQISTRETVKGAQSLGIVSRDARMADATWTTELADVSDDTQLVFGRRELSPKQLKKVIRVSEKLLLNSTRNAEDIVNAELAYIVGITLEKGYVTGSGVGQPLGIFTASNDGISTARDTVASDGSQVITANGLVDSFYSLKQQYRSSKNCRWMFHRNRIRDIRKIVDGMGRYIWLPGLGGADDNSLLGVPVMASEYAPSGTTSGSYFGVIGDFTYYTVADGYDLGVRRLDQLYIRTGQIGFMSTSFHDGMPTLAEAFTRLKYQ